MSKVIRYTFSLMAIIIIATSLSGCNKGRDRIHKYIAEVKRRPPAGVEPLPEIKKVPKHTYASHHKRSPFETRVVKMSSEFQPDMNRPKEPLESYSLDSLKMVGSFNKGKTKWALISTKDEKVIPVTLGNYIGKNFGEITGIDDSEVTIEETVKGPDGWTKRTGILVLRD